MGSAYWGAYAHVLTIEQVEAVIKDKLDLVWNYVEKLTKDSDRDYDGLFKAWEYTDRDDVIEWIDDLESEGVNFSEDQIGHLENLITAAFSAFCSRTKGLELGIVRNPEPCRGDELEGGSFTVENIYQETPQYKKFKAEFGPGVHVSWVQYG
jgi:hypothetical protein